MTRVKGTADSLSIPGTRGFIAALGILLFIALAIIGSPQNLFAQTPSITLTVNGQTNANNQFFFPFGTNAFVSLSSSISNAIIYYTTNGSGVEIDSPIYSGPFTTSNSIHIQAFATDASFDESTPILDGSIQFVPAYSLSDATPGGGTVSFSPPGGIYASNTAVTLKANPAPGWAFSNWSGDASGTDTNLQIVITNATTVKAVFVTSVSMSAIPADTGSVQGIPSGGVYAYGTVVSVAAVPGAGKYFFHWVNSSFGAISPINITITNSGINCSAFFNSLTNSDVSLALIASGPGAVQATPSSNYFPLNTAVSVTATASSGNGFIGWSGDASGTDNPLMVMMNSSKVITAVFGAAPTNGLLLTLLANGSGIVSNSTPPEYYTNGQATLITALPAPGYVFLNWSGAATGSQNPLPVIVNSNETITANFVAASPPVISLQPVNITESAGYPVSFNVNASGQMPLYYQWFYNGAAIPGATSSSYSIAALHTNNTGNYFVRITNATTTVVSSNVSVTVTQPYTFATLAGIPGRVGGLDGYANSALFNFPAGLAVDGQGNIYVTDEINDAIRKITPSGIVTTLAGALGQSSSGDGIGIGAYFDRPTDVVVDRAGNVYVADNGNFTIRKISPDGTTVTLAGKPGTSGREDGTGSDARFGMPTGVGVDTNGNVYVADSGNNIIREVTQSGVVTTVPNAFDVPYSLAFDTNGSLYVADPFDNTILINALGVPTRLAGSVGHAGSADGTGNAAQFNNPMALTVDNAGNVYVADTENSVIRKITPAGIVTTIGGLVGGLGTNDGSGISARFNLPFGIAVDNAGRIYVADSFNNTIRVGVPAQSAPAIIIQPLPFTESATYGANFSVLAASDSAATYQWYQNGNLIPGATNSTYSITNLQMTDAGNYSVLVANATGSILSSNALLTVENPYTFVTYVGSPGQSGTNDGNSLVARFSETTALGLDAASNLYVGDLAVHALRKVAPGGMVSTITAAIPGIPYGLTLDSMTNIYMTAQATISALIKVTPGGTVSTITQFNGGFPQPLALDGQGDFYVGDDALSYIEKVAPDGTKTTFTGEPSSSGNGQEIDGVGTSAEFLGPAGFAEDSSGNLYVADGGCAIRKVTPSGVVTTIAGRSRDSRDVDGPASVARFTQPNGIALDRAGNIYVCETGGNTIRKISTNGLVTTVAGTMNQPGGTNDGTGINARFHFPFSLVVDGSGKIYVADYFNYTVRAGVPANSSPVILTQPQPFTETATYSGSFTVTAIGQAPLFYQWYQNGVAINGATNSSYAINSLQPVNAGTYYVTISNALGAVTSSNVTPTIEIPYYFTTLAGSPGVTGIADGMGSSARFNRPEGVAVDSSGNVYVSDTGNATIRKISSAGVVTTFAGTPGKLGSSDGVGTNATFNTPYNLSMDTAGNIYVAEYGNDLIRKISPSANVTTLAGQAGGAFEMDGAGNQAAFYYPTGIATDTNGTVFVTDSYGETVRQVTSGGIVTTIAGLNSERGSTDGVGAAALFNGPQSVAIDAGGNLYIADVLNANIRKVAPGGVVTTLTGLSRIIDNVDGPLATARFGEPTGLTADKSGNVFVVDENNNNVRKIGADGIVMTIAGKATVAGNSADGIGQAALFASPQAITVDNFGDLYVADYNNSTIRKGVPANPIFQTSPQSQAAVSGTTITLSPGFTGAPPMNFQWRFNGATLPEATNATLQLSNLSSSFTGAYDLIVTNIYGTATSGVANVSVTGTLVTQPSLNSTFSAANSPYVISQNFTANNLVIQPGVSVLFNGPYSLTITGLLTALGTSNAPITFGPIAPNIGWQGVRFVSADTNSAMSWCIVEGSTAGGIRFSNTPFVLDHCTINNNSGVTGGGIYSDSPLLLQNCSILNNAAAFAPRGNAYAVQGGGLFSAGGGVTLLSCLVSNNTAIMPSASVTNETSTGGGIDCESGLLTLSNCTVTANAAVGAGQSATEVGGGIYVDSAAAALAASGCNFQNNQVPGGFGGALAVGKGALNNCVFVQNAATFGGAVWIGGTGQTTATNCIFSANAATIGGAVYSSAGVAAGDFENCTLTQNSPDAFNGFTGVIHDSIVYSNGNEIVPGMILPVVSYNDIRGGYGPGTNNLDVDPQFADTNYDLVESSAVIDAGDPAPQFNDAAFPPSQGSDRNDLGAYGGPGAAFWPAILAAAPIVLVNGQPVAPESELNFPDSAPPTISFTNGYNGGTFEYTLDGSNPLDFSTFTSAPFVLTNSARVRVIAFSPDIVPYAIAAPVTINVLPSYNLSAGSAGGGVVTPSSGIFLSNTVVTLTATSAPGWTFLNWAGDASGNQNPLTLVVNGSKNVQAVFGTSLTVTVAGNGIVQTNPVLPLYPYGSTNQLMAIPNTASSYFRQWSGAASNNNFSPLNFVVTNANPIIAALFGGLPATATNYTLNLLVNGPGTITRNPQASYYSPGSAVIVTAAPSAGSQFTGWSGDVASTSNPLNVTLNNNLTITANFASTNPTPSQPPTIIITSPANNSAFGYQSSIEILVHAGDANIGGVVTQVVFYSGSAMIGAISNSQPATFNSQFTWTNAAIGTNVVTAIAYANTGLSTLSLPVNLIVNPPPPGAPVFTVSSPSYSVFENGGFATVTVQKNLNSLGGTVNFSTVNGSAFAVSNYQAVAGPLTFASNDTSRNITIPIFYSSVYQGNKTFNLALSPSGDGSTIGTPAAAAVTIVDVNPPSTNPPVFAFSTNNYSVNENSGSVVLTVLNTGGSGGLVNYTTADGTAFGGSGFSGSYTIASGPLAFNNGQSSATITVGIRDNFLTGSDLQFQVQLFSPSQGTLGQPATATVTIHQADVGGASNSLLTVAAPTAQPAANAQLTVFLTPPQANGQWRFPWDLAWRNSGDTAANLIAGNYPIEFRSVPGYLVIPPAAPIAVSSGASVSTTNQYLPGLSGTATNGTGSITVNISPNSPAGDGWRFIGETAWRAPGSTVSGLVPDTYDIEFAPVAGYARPGSEGVEVASGQGETITVSYSLPSSPPSGAVLPAPVISSSINDIRDFPFGFNGQLQTDAGFGSGVAARETVVLTAAHLVFNDATLSYTEQAYWSFQEEVGIFEPEPIPARGWYVLGGYATQRTNDLETGGFAVDQSSPQSRQSDAAALYFLTPVARGGFGGYLASDASPNPYLTGSNLKMLVGYPVDGSTFGATVQPGTMYSTQPLASVLTQASNNVYTASWLLSYPGNSGGPLYVQFNNYYYPAGIYLGTLGSGVNSVSLVRAINSDVVNLINLAASEGDSTNNAGGGVLGGPSTLILGEGLSVTHPAYLQLLLGPPSAVQAGAGWRLQGDSTYGSATNYTRLVVTTNAAVEFKSIPGWNLPLGQTIKVIPGSLTVLSNQFYTVLPPKLSLDAVNGLRLAGTANTSYRIEYRTNLTTGQWLPLRTNTLGAGLTQIAPWPPSNISGAYYRAVWLMQ
ncbi:MAG TPA: Calx-beta domain-containing protein [Verrucomicrobiae bacterium]|nr:Calx-beta domain-containing protein [Verrucomicrobiae bacterium]